MDERAESAWAQFDGYLRALRVKLTRERRSASERELARLRELWEAADDAWQRYWRNPVGWYFPARAPAWELLEAELAAEVPVATIALDQREPGRPKGSYIELDTFWRVWEMVLDEDASARAIDKETKHEAEYVNKEKAGVIVKAVHADRDAARAALGDRKIPPSFSVTSYGVKLPMPRRR